MMNQTVMNPEVGTSITLPPPPSMWTNNFYREGFFTGALVAAVVAFGLSLLEEELKA